MLISCFLCWYFISSVSSVRIYPDTKQKMICSRSVGQTSALAFIHVYLNNCMISFSFESVVAQFFGSPWTSLGDCAVVCAKLEMSCCSRLSQVNFDMLIKLIMQNFAGLRIKTGAFIAGSSGVTATSKGFVWLHDGIVTNPLLKLFSLLVRICRFWEKSSLSRAKTNSKGMPRQT